MYSGIWRDVTRAWLDRINRLSEIESSSFKHNYQKQIGNNLFRPSDVLSLSSNSVHPFVIISPSPTRNVQFRNNELIEAQKEKFVADNDA